MWVMAKSALCIGIVSVFATGASGGGDLPSTFGVKGRDVATGIVRACAASPDCIGLGARALSAATDPGGEVPGAVARVVLASAIDARVETTAAVPPLPYGRAAAAPLPPERRPHRKIASHR